MLIAKGYSPSFILVDGRTIRPPRGAALLHDPTGRQWPSCSGLILAFRKTRETSPDATAEEYLGYEPKLGLLALPRTKVLSQWTHVGDVADSICAKQGDCGEVLYSRKGKHAGAYYHPVEGGTTRLYRLGRALRIELGRGCVWNWRGIVKP